LRIVGVIHKGEGLARKQPPYWLGLFLSQTFSRMDTPTILKFSHATPTRPMTMEQTECSETSAYKIQTPGYYPEENI